MLDTITYIHAQGFFLYILVLCINLFYRKVVLVDSILLFVQNLSRAPQSFLVSSQAASPVECMSWSFLKPYDAMIQYAEKTQSKAQFNFNILPMFHFMTILWKALRKWSCMHGIVSGERKDLLKVVLFFCVVSPTISTTIAVLFICCWIDSNIMQKWECIYTVNAIPDLIKIPLWL